MPYGGDLRAAFNYFMDEDREEFAEALTRDGLKAGLSVAEFWQLPIHHMFFQFLKPPESSDDFDRMKEVTEQNRHAVKPFVLWDILTHCRG